MPTTCEPLPSGTDSGMPLPDSLDDLVDALLDRLASVRSRSEAARVLLPGLRWGLALEDALLVLTDRMTGRPTIFGGHRDQQVELGSWLRGLSPEELRKVLDRGFDLDGAAHTEALPLSAGLMEEGVLLVARDTPFTPDEGRALRILVRFTGAILRSVALHAQLDQAYAEVRKSRARTSHGERLQALGQLASGIAHDVNNALSPITAYSALLLADGAGLSRDQHRFIELIHRAGSDVTRILGRIRDLYRTREESEYPMGPVAASTLLDEVVALTRPRWRDLAMVTGRHFTVTGEAAPGVPPVLGNDTELREALTNLVLNAADALEADGDSITLRALRAGDSPDLGDHPPDMVLLEVADTGRGMDPETLRRCQEPFFTTKGRKGSGLGMAQVKAIVQRHAGRLLVESAPGEGTTVRLLLPAFRGRRPTSHMGDDGPPPSLRILCIDDDPTQRLVLEEVLAAQGHRVAVADSGRAGVADFLRALQAEVPYDVVITDLGMPDVDGRGVIRAVRDTSPGTGLILLTGWTAAIPGKGLPEGVHRVLSKPLRPEQLAEALGAMSRVG